MPEGVIVRTDQRLAIVEAVIAIGVDEVRELIDPAHAVVHIIARHPVGLQDVVHADEGVEGLRRDLRGGDICTSPLFLTVVALAGQAVQAVVGPGEGRTQMVGLEDSTHPTVWHRLLAAGWGYMYFSPFLNPFSFVDTQQKN